MNINNLVRLFFVALLTIPLTSPHKNCAHLEFENLPSNTIRVRENGFINLTFSLTIENCNPDRFYIIKLAIVDDRKDLCRVVYDNGAYTISDNSANCRLDSSGDKIKFSHSVTSSDTGLKVSLSSVDMKSSVTNWTHVTFFNLCHEIRAGSTMTPVTQGAHLEFENLPSNTIRVRENGFINLTFSLKIENCNPDRFYIIKLAIVDDRKDLCRVVYNNSAYIISDNSANCRLDSSGDKIKFSHSVTSSDTGLKVSLSSVDITTSVTNWTYVTFFNISPAESSTWSTQGWSSTTEASCKNSGNNTGRPNNATNNARTNAKSCEKTSRLNRQILLDCHVLPASRTSSDNDAVFRYITTTVPPFGATDRITGNKQYKICKLHSCRFVPAV